MSRFEFGQRHPLVLKPADGDSPSWRRRIVYELKQDDIEMLQNFCMDDAYALGYEDDVISEVETDNFRFESSSKQHALRGVTIVGAFGPEKTGVGVDDKNQRKKGIYR